MKNTIILILIILIISCNEKKVVELSKNPKSEKKELDFNFKWKAKQKPFSEIDKTLENLTDSLTVEFIYPEKKKIIEQDSALIVYKLKQKGFKKIDAGRGNWMEGPRFLYIKLESEDMICVVDKLYYSDSTKTEESEYKVSERLSCLAKQ